jgi:hypothetical protein
MTGKVTIQDRVSLADVFRGYPLAHKVFAAGAIVFILFNFWSWVGSSTSYPPYARWLEISQPFTDAVAVIFPAVDSATRFLEKPRSTGPYSYMVPAVRNLLSVNFFLFLFLLFCFAIASCIDLFREPERVWNNIDAVSKRLNVPMWNQIVRFAIFLVIFFLPFYFGYASNPYLVALAPNVIFYAVVFGVCGLMLFVAICFIISLIALRLKSYRST